MRRPSDRIGRLSDGACFLLESSQVARLSKRSGAMFPTPRTSACCGGSAAKWCWPRSTTSSPRASGRNSRRAWRCVWAERQRWRRLTTTALSASPETRALLRPSCAALPSKRADQRRSPLQGTGAGRPDAVLDRNFDRLGRFRFGERLDLEAGHQLGQGGADGAQALALHAQQAGRVLEFAHTGHQLRVGAH